MGRTIFHGPVVGVILASTLAAASPSTGAGSDRDETLQAGSAPRQYHLHLPPAGGRIPLVLVFHGGGGTGRGTARLYGFNDLADARGVAIAYPEGLDHHWNDGRASTVSSQC